MDIGQFIHQYGYLAVAIGSFFEGEAVLLGGILPSMHGYFELPVIFAIGAVGSFAGDLPYFFAGRRYGPAALARFPSVLSRQQRIDRFMQRHCVLLVLVLRFLYGFRIAGLLTLGMSRLSTFRFLCLDLIGALIWAGSITAAGLGAGHLLRKISQHATTPSQWLLLTALLAGASLLYMTRRRRQLARITAASHHQQ